VYRATRVQVNDSAQILRMDRGKRLMEGMEMD